MSSYFERKCVPGARVVAVASQGDEPFRSTAQNQCGWCALSLAARGRGLAAALAAGDDAAVRALHAAALAEASQRRAAAQAAPGANASGENVDHAAVVEAARAAVRFEPLAGAGGAAAFAAAELNPELRDMSLASALDYAHLAPTSNQLPTYPGPLSGVASKPTRTVSALRGRRVVYARAA